MSELHSPAVEAFSLTQGGPIYRLQVHLGGVRPEQIRAQRRVLLLILGTWVPLLALSAVQGLAWGNRVQIPFLRDFAVNVRYLIALPILILAEPMIDRRLRLLVRHFLDSGLVQAAELPSFDAALESVTRLRDRVLPELLLVFISFFPSLVTRHVEVLLLGISNWHFLPGSQDAVSLAGRWFAFIAMPLFRFLLLRWAWRIFLWSTLLWRVSRLKLYLTPTHPDQSAGLGFLSEGQLRLSPIVFAMGTVIAAQVGNAITYEGQTLSSLKVIMIAYGAFAVLLLAAPLLLLTPRLLKVKRQGLLEYGVLASSYTQSFDSKWVHGKPPEETLLGSADLQSLADLNNSFAVVRELRPIPVDRNTLVGLAVAALLPLVPVILLATPTDELVRAVLKMLA